MSGGRRRAPASAAASGDRLLAYLAERDDAETRTTPCHPATLPSPIEIIALLRPTFTFHWADGHESAYSARDLRLRCKCAMCVEEMTGRPLLDPASVAEGVCATALSTVGNYGVSVAWSDGHSTGIYNWRDLRAGCPCISCMRIRARGHVAE